MTVAAWLFLTLVLMLQAGDLWSTYKVLDAGGKEENPLILWLTKVIPLKVDLALFKSGVAVLTTLLTYALTPAYPQIVVSVLAGLSALYIWVVTHNLKQLANLRASHSQ